jgi:hypothetical protein
MKPKDCKCGKCPECMHVKAFNEMRQRIKNDSDADLREVFRQLEQIVLVTKAQLAATQEEIRERRIKFEVSS